jgi:protein involved in polysaccharide export with SLBB domain
MNQVQANPIVIIRCCRALFCLFLFALSMPLGGDLARAQLAGASAGVDGGTLGNLLGQLQTLQETGAIDALGGAASSPLDVTRRQGLEATLELQQRNVDTPLIRERQFERRGLLTQPQQIVAERFCQGALPRQDLALIRVIRQFSPLEKDYCQRAAELLLQYGYELFGDEAELDALEIGVISADYTLGVGDELILTFHGRQNNVLSIMVDREGKLMIPEWKPIHAAGRTFGEVRREIAARTASTQLGTEVFISLGAVRTVSVLVVGEVHEPGRQLLTALSTVVNAIRAAGGVKKTGSVRRIHLQRGDQIHWIDAYDLLYSGIAARDLNLRDGDRIIVPPLGHTFAVTGDARRPGIYEMPEGRRTLRLAEALDLAGGSIRPRGNKFQQLTFTASGHQKLNEHNNLAAAVQDGDIVRIARRQDIQLGTVHISGHVRMPGRRALSSVSTVAQLLGDPTTLKPNPYLLFGALLTTDPQTQATRFFPLNLRNILHGQQDYSLRDGDRLIVLSSDDIRFLSSAEVQDTVARRIDAEIKRQNLTDQAAKPDTDDKISADWFSDPLSGIRRTLAAGRGDDASGKDKSGDEKAGETGEDEVSETCEGMRRLSAIVSSNSANRYANAVRTLDTVGLDQANGRACPDIFDQFGALLPLALEHVVAINGEVRDPGTYPVVGNVNLTDLIAVSGGLTREVDLTRVEVSRYTADSAKGVSNTSRGLIDIAKAGADKVSVGPGDVVRFNPVATDRDTGPVLLVGEFIRPGLYEIRRGERLSEVMARAGGLTEQAYPYGAVFTRQRVRTAQQAGLQRAARELNSALAVAAVQRNVNPTSVLALQQFARQLGTVEALGRVVMEADPTVLQVRPELDAVLEPGDKIYMPKRPNFVTVIGDVLNPGAMQFIAGTTADEYIRQAGSFQRSADEDRVFAVYPNGIAEPLAVSVWNFNPAQIPPGSTIVVPKDPAPLDLLTLVREGSSILSQLAVTAASLAVISRD